MISSTLAVRTVICVQLGHHVAHLSLKGSTAAGSLRVFPVSREEPVMRLRLAVCLGCLLFVAASVSAAPGNRSPDGVWVEVDPAALGEVRQPLPTEFHAYRLDLDAM